MSSGDMVKVSRPSNRQFSQEPQVRIGRSQFNRRITSRR